MEKARHCVDFALRLCISVLKNRHILVVLLTQCPCNHSVSEVKGETCSCYNLEKHSAIYICSQQKTYAHCYNSKIYMHDILDFMMPLDIIITNDIMLMHMQ